MSQLGEHHITIQMSPDSWKLFKSELARIIASGSGLEHTLPAIEAALSGDKSVELPDLDPLEVLRANSDSVKELLNRLEFRVLPHEGGGE